MDDTNNINSFIITSDDYDELQLAQLKDSSLATPEHGKTGQFSHLNHEYGQISIPQDVKSIQEMEKLRQQIQNMIQPYSLNLSNIEQSIENKSIASEGTDRRLKADLLHSSPQLQLDENGVLMSSNNSNGFLHKHSSPIQDSSLISENTILKDNIEKERYRRKHCEKTIQELQHRLLETQEQLAVSVSTDKKKETMIEQLDRTLANVVQGWKNHESERINLIERLKKEIHFLESSKADQDRALKQFENDLSHAVMELGKEQERAHQTEEENRKMYSQMESDHANLRQKFEELQQRNSSLENTRDVFVNKKETLTTQVETLSQERVHLDIEKKQLEQKVIGLENEYKTIISAFQEQLEEAQAEIQDTKDKLNTTDLNCQKLESEIDANVREKEALKMELSLFESKFEAVKTKQDSEMRIKLEEEFNEKINEIQMEIMHTEEELRSSQRKQIQCLTLKHREEMEGVRQKFLKEISKSEEISRRRVDEYEGRLDAAHKQINNLTNKRQQLESQRGDLMRRMQAMMQQQWKETVSILNANEAPERASHGSKFATPQQLSSTMQNSLSTTPTKDHDLHQNSGHFSSSQVKSTGGTSHQSLHTNNSHVLQSQKDPFDSFAAQSVHFQRYGLDLSIPTSNSYQHHPNTPQQYDLFINPIRDTTKQSINFSQNLSQRSEQNNKDMNIQFAPNTHLLENVGQGSNAPFFFLPKNHPSVESSIGNQAPVHTDSNSGTMPMHSLNVMDPLLNQEDPISLLYQDLDASVDDDNSASLGTDNPVQQERQTQLTHFINKLLESSPTNYIEEDNNVEESPVRDNPRANTVSQDVEKVLKTPEKARQIKVAAFKKSVIKDPGQVVLLNSNKESKQSTTSNIDMSQSVTSQENQPLSSFKTMQHSSRQPQSSVDVNAFLELFQAFTVSQSQKQVLEEKSNDIDISKLQKVYNQVSKKMATAPQKLAVKKGSKTTNKIQGKRLSQLKHKNHPSEPKTQPAKHGTAWK